MKHIFISIVTILAVGPSFGQKGALFAEFNYNTFSHSSLKNFQEEFVADIQEVDIRVNDNFPSNFGFTVGYRIPRINTSIFGSYTTTGGKISYSDFSGTIRLTQPLKGYTAGGIYEIKLLKAPDKNHLSLGFRGFLTFSTLDIVSFNDLNGNQSTEIIGTSSFDFGGGASLIYEYPISIIKIRATLGFDVVLGGKQFLDGDRDFFIEDNSGDPVRTEWTGLRAGLGIAVPL